MLEEKDFIKLVALEEKYSFYKNVVNIQPLTVLNENKIEKSLVKIMLKLIDYYAQCIS